MPFLQITDYIIVGAAVIFGVLGLCKGLTKQIFSIVAIVGGVAATIFLGPTIADKFATEGDPSSRYVYYLATFVVVFLVVRIIGGILSKGVDKSALGFVNKLLGLAWGVAKVGIIASVILLGYNAITKIGFIANLLEKWIDLENKGWGVTVWLYENNFITLIINWIESR